MKSTTKKQSKSQMIINYLAKGHSLTVVQSIQKFQYQELRSMLPELKQRIGIQYCSDYVEGKHYKHYWICPEWLKTAKAQRVIEDYTTVRKRA